MTFQTVFKNDKEFEEFKTWTLGVLHDEKINVDFLNESPPEENNGDEGG